MLLLGGKINSTTIVIAQLTRVVRWEFFFLSPSISFAQKHRKKYCLFKHLFKHEFLLIENGQKRSQPFIVGDINMRFVVVWI